MRHPPPAELGLLGLSVENFVRADVRSWRGPCPRCGGHRRLLVFTDHPFPKWHVICDLCGLKAWADQLNTTLNAPVTTEQRQYWAAENTRAEAARAEYRRQRLAEFTTAELWLEFHERMTEAQRAWWEQQGIPHEWQDFYRLGYTPNKTFAQDGARFERPAYTIPIFDVGRVPVNMQYRIVDPPAGVGKYRQEHGIPAAAFLSDPDIEMPDELLIVEGAKKAAVTFIHLSPTLKLVVGLPGARSWAGMVERVKACGRVWIALDPDAYTAALDLAKAIGKAARCVTLPCKPDDLLTQYGGTADDLRRAMREARKL